MFILQDVNAFLQNSTGKLVMEKEAPYL